MVPNRKAPSWEGTQRFLLGHFDGLGTAQDLRVEGVVQLTARLLTAGRAATRSAPSLNTPAVFVWGRKTSGPSEKIEQKWLRNLRTKHKHTSTQAYKDTKTQRQHTHTHTHTHLGLNKKDQPKSQSHLLGCAFGFPKQIKKSTEAQSWALLLVKLAA